MITSTTFTPAASAHGALDVVGGVGSFSFYATDWKGRECFIIRGASIAVPQGAALATDWQVHLYSVTPPSAQLDDAVFDISTADLDVYLGKVLTGTTVDIGATQFAETHGLAKIIPVFGPIVYARLVNVSGVTLTAVAHKVTLYCEKVGG